MSDTIRSTSYYNQSGIYVIIDESVQKIYMVKALYIKTSKGTCTDVKNSVIMLSLQYPNKGHRDLREPIIHLFSTATRVD